MARWVWIFAALLAAAPVSAQPGDPQRCCMDGYSTEIAREPAVATAWRGDRIDHFALGPMPTPSPLAMAVYPYFKVWPTSITLGGKTIAVGDQLPVLRLRCMVDQRRGKPVVTCRDGRALGSFHVEDTSRFYPQQTAPFAQALACYAVTEATPTAKELTLVQTALAAAARRGQYYGTMAWPAPLAGRIVWIDLLERGTKRDRHIVRKPDGRKKTVRDVTEWQRISTVANRELSAISERSIMLPLVLPVGADHNPVPQVAEMLKERGSLGVYQARAFAALDLRGLSPALVAALTYDRAVAAFTIGDVARGTAEFQSLERALAAKTVPAEITTLVDPQLPLLRQLARGELVPWDPCAGRRTLEWL